MIGDPGEKGWVLVKGPQPFSDSPEDAGFSRGILSPSIRYHDTDCAFSVMIYGKELEFLCLPDFSPISPRLPVCYLFLLRRFVNTKRLSLRRVASPAI